MSNSRRHLRQLSCWAMVAILFSGVVWAQLDQSRPAASDQQDVFATWHEALSDAADRTLAVALADRAWMNIPGAGTAGTSRLAGTAARPVVRFRAAVDRVQQLRPAIEPILREEGLPAELSAVVLVESGGLTAALSPKGARGLWQFMPDTARRYGLAVSAGRDERLDVAKSTHAAARYLRDLYLQFGDWQLALAAYNAGEQAVGLAMSRTRQREFSSIQSALPQETRNYVPAVMAAMSRLQNELKKPTHFIYASIPEN